MRSELPTGDAGKVLQAVFAFGQTVKVAGFQITCLKGFVAQSAGHAFEHCSPFKWKRFFLGVEDLQQGTTNTAIRSPQQGVFDRFEIA